MQTILFCGLARYPNNQNQKNLHKKLNSFQSKCQQCKQRWQCAVQ